MRTSDEFFTDVATRPFPMSTEAYTYRNVTSQSQLIVSHNLVPLDLEYLNFILLV